MEIFKQKDESKFPTHKDFCEFIKIFRKDKPPLSKWLSYPLYVISILSIGIFIATIAMSFGGSRGRRNDYPSDKYRKVVKEGIFWDSTEWHER